MVVRIYESGDIMEFAQWPLAATLQTLKVISWGSPV
jgi:hypothetical protein